MLVAQSCLTLETPWTVACPAPLSMRFSRQEYWSGLPFPSPYNCLCVCVCVCVCMLVAQSCLTLCECRDGSPPGSSVDEILQARVLEWVAISFSIQLKLMSIELEMPFNHLILCCPVLLLPSIFPNIRAFSSGSVLCIRWTKYWSFSFSISPYNEYS